jgi:hypothetical protein
MTETNSFPNWNHDKAKESLDKVYEWTIQIAWYEKKKKPNRILSQLIRFLSVLLAGIGALCPLIDATKIYEAFNFSQWGYVFLALAAGIAGFDYYFGCSSGWMRKIVTQVSLERVLKEFRYDWAILEATSFGNGERDNSVAFLKLSKEFTTRTENLVKQETDAWVAEFRTNISNLEKVLKTEIDARKQGSIRVVVKNSSDFENVDIFLNDIFVKQLKGVSEGVINDVGSGQHEVMVIGERAGKTSKETKVIEVRAGVLTSAEFNI